MNRLGDETSSPLSQAMCDVEKDWHERSLVARKICLSTNRKSHFLSLFFSQPCPMIKTFFHSPGSQLKMLMSVWTLVNLFHVSYRKMRLICVSNACRKT